MKYTCHLRYVKTKVNSRESATDGKDSPIPMILGKRKNDWQDDEELQQKYRMQAQGYDLEKLLQRVAEIMDMSSEAIMDSGKNRKGAQARSILCCWATDQLRISQTRLGQMLNLTQPAVSEAVKRGKQLAKMHGYSLIEENKL